MTAVTGVTADRESPIRTEDNARLGKLVRMAPVTVTPVTEGPNMAKCLRCDVNNTRGGEPLCYACTNWGIAQERVAELREAHVCYCACGCQVWVEPAQTFCRDCGPAMWGTARGLWLHRVTGVGARTWAPPPRRQYPATTMDVADGVLEPVPMRLDECGLCGRSVMAWAAGPNAHQRCIEAHATIAPSTEET